MDALWVEADPEMRWKQQVRDRTEVNKLSLLSRVSRMVCSSLELVQI